MATQANPFDQFDARNPPNPFDQFDASSTAPAGATPPRLSVAQEKQILQLVNNPSIAPQAVVDAMRRFQIDSSPEEIVRARKLARSQGNRVVGFNYQDSPRPEKASREGLDLAGQYAGVVTRALAPYLTVAGLGAAAGAPAAGVGAIPGAAAGVLSLGLADLGTTAYNAVAPVFGGQRVPTGSETIQNFYGDIGVGRRPETPGQQVFSDILQGAGGATSQAAAFGNLALKQAPGVTRNIMQSLSTSPKAQAFAGGGAAGAPSIAQNYFDVNDPVTLTGLSVAGGMAGGRAGTSRPTKITAADLDKTTKTFYKAAKAEGVEVSGEGMTKLKTLIDDMLTELGHDPVVHPLVEQVRRKFARTADKPMSFETLEELRKTVRDFPYTQGGGKRGTSRERAVVGMMSDAVNDFMMTGLTTKELTAGNPANAARYLDTARKVARQNFEAGLVEKTTQTALNRETGTAAKNLRTEFGKIANNENRMLRLKPELQRQIDDLAKGKGFNALESAGKFAPNMNLTNIGALSAGGAVPVYLGAPEATVLAGLGTLGALGSKYGANRIAKTQANNMADMARGNPEFKLPLGIPAQTAQIALQQGFPLMDIDGAPLVEIGEFDGYPVPIYGRPRR